MKTCPTCHTEYEDSMTMCTKDGATLVAAPQLPKNPPLPKVQAADAGATTSDVETEPTPVASTQTSNNPPKTPLPEPQVTSQSSQHNILKNKVKSPFLSRNTLIIASIALLLIAGGITAFIFLKPKSPLVDFVSAPAGATVLIDGQVKGTTPLQLRLPVGQYQVTFSQNGFETLSETLLVTKEGASFSKVLTQVK